MGSRGLGVLPFAPSNFVPAFEGGRRKTKRGDKRKRKGSKREKMGWIGDTVDSIKSIQIRQLVTQAVSLGMYVNGFSIIFFLECHKSACFFSLSNLLQIC